MSIQDQIFGMTSATRDTLRCLFLKGPTWDGDLPSKTGRDALVERGMAERWNGWQWLTLSGVRFAVEVMMLDREKEKRG